MLVPLVATILKPAFATIAVAIFVAAFVAMLARRFERARRGRLVLVVLFV
jgi:hypothetical protein